MSQENDNNNHAANVIADEIAFAPGKRYTSQHEFWQDCRNPRYKFDQVFHARVEAKFLQSFGGATGAEGVRSVSASGNVKRAQASHDADGNIQAVQIGMDGRPIGSGGSDDEGNNGGGGSGPVQVRTLSGGTRSVTLRSGDASEVKKQLPKESQPVSRMTFSQHNGTR